VQCYNADWTTRYDDTTYGTDTGNWEVRGNDVCERLTQEPFWECGPVRSFGNGQFGDGAYTWTINETAYFASFEDKHNIMTSAKIIVLEAGISGLGAARALADSGADVMVIEARTPTSYERTLAYDGSGDTFNFDDLASEVERIVEAARDAVDDFDADMSLKDAVEKSPEWAAMTPAKRQLIRLAIHMRVEHEYSGDWSKLSAWFFDDGEDFPGGDAVMARGFAPLTNHLVRGLDIRLGEVVKRLDPCDGGVQIQTTAGPYIASKVIVTLPLSVLKSGDIQFGRPLKKKRQAAIDGLQMGLLNKCWLRFDRVFWPEDIDWIDFLDTKGGQEPGFFSGIYQFQRANRRTFVGGVQRRSTCRNVGTTG
jgi:hypothetical protein